MTAPRVGNCECGRIAIARLGCPCGWSIAYCAPCAQTAMQAATEHVLDCDRAERASAPAVRRAGIPCLDPRDRCVPDRCNARPGWCERRDRAGEVRP